jgi:pyrrolidone-carboxylate peptidase
MIDIIITGFGPFPGVDDNPTQKIVQRLCQYLKDHEEIQDGDTTTNNIRLSGRVRTIFIETSYEAAKNAIDTLYNELLSHSNNYNDTIILLLLGVGSSMYQLEQYAYNKKDVGIDGEGNSLHQTICTSHSIETKLTTTIGCDLDDIAKQLNNNNLYCNAAIVNKDPDRIGYFVCNYIYYYGLHKFKVGCSGIDSKNSIESISNDEHVIHNEVMEISCLPLRVNVKCLFVHVPPVTGDVATVDQELRCIVDLMYILHKQWLP